MGRDAASAIIGLLAVGLTASSAAAQPRAIAFAPYAYMTDGADVLGWARATGQLDLTLAFFNATGGRCEGSWASAEPPILAQARALQARGGRIIVSTGGWNADDLAERCPSPLALADVYDGVLQRFHADWLDLDAEPGDVHDNLAPAVVDRRSAAMRILQDRFAARGRRLHLSFTLAVRPAFGMDAANFYVLKSARAAGVSIDLVNAMVMDYRDGASAGRMGARSIEALEHTHDQLAQLYPARSDSARWSMIAATPMLGQNDAEPEVFTLRDARLLTNFAARKGMARLSFWALSRDNGGCAGNKKAQSSCSGLDQPAWAFSRIFADFARTPGQGGLSTGDLTGSRFASICRNDPGDETICSHIGAPSP